MNKQHFSWQIYLQETEIWGTVRANIHWYSFLAYICYSWKYIIVLNSECQWNYNGVPSHKKGYLETYSYFPEQWHLLNWSTIFLLLWTIKVYNNFWETRHLASSNHHDQTKISFLITFKLMLYVPKVPSPFKVFNHNVACICFLAALPNSSHSTS
jgi:hypothetical protein